MGWNANLFGITLGCIIAVILLMFLAAKTKKDGFVGKILSLLMLAAFLIGLTSLIIFIGELVYANLPSINPCPNPENCDPSNQWP